MKTVETILEEIQSRGVTIFRGDEPWLTYKNAPAVTVGTWEVRALPPKERPENTEHPIT